REVALICPLCANCVPMQRSKQHPIRSPRRRARGGIFRRPSAFAVLEFGSDRSIELTGNIGNRRRPGIDNDPRALEIRDLRESSTREGGSLLSHWGVPPRAAAIGGLPAAVRCRVRTDCTKS